MNKSHLLLPLYKKATEINDNLSKRQQLRAKNISGGGLNFLMWEQAPCMRTISVIHAKEYNYVDECYSRPYTLRFPYLIFITRGARRDTEYDEGIPNRIIMCACSTSPIESLEDSVYFIPLSNIYEKLNVCQEVSSNLKEAVKNFWNTSFYEYEWLGDLIRNKLSGLGSYAEWEELSKECPDLLEDVWNSFRWGTLEEMVNIDFEALRAFQHKIQHKIRASGLPMAYCRN